MSPPEQWDAIPVNAKIQILAWIGFLEFYSEIAGTHYMKGGVPGKYPSFAETGFDAVAHVGIDGDTVTTVSTGALRGRTVLNAAGLVVAPGFIDILSYRPNGYGDWYKKNNLKDCPNGYTVVQAPCFGNDGLTTVKMAVKGHEISCPGLTSVSCPYDRARPGENQKCVACVRRGQNGRCRVDTRFVPCG